VDKCYPLSWYISEHAQKAAGVSEANMPQSIDWWPPAAFDRSLADLTVVGNIPVFCAKVLLRIMIFVTFDLL
jgi:hypothetical protein